MKAQPPEAAFATFQHFGFAAGIQADAAANLWWFADAQLCARFIPCQQTLDQKLHPPAAGFVAKQTRRDHPGVVEYQ